MKNNLSILAFALLMASACCKEKEIVLAPYVPPSPNSASGDRHVLVEELTGVRCTNCPDGARTLLSLQSAVGASKLIILSNHSAGAFSVPYSDSKYDFRSPEAQSMANSVGQAIGFPTAAINRAVPTGGTDPYVSAGLWSGLVSSQLAKPNVLNMALNTAYDTTSRRVDVTVAVVPLEDLEDQHRLTVVITQDKIVDPQLDNGVKIKDYLHRHVLRGTLSSPTGDILNQDLTAGKKIELKYKFTIPQTWVAKDCSIVAFVHRGGTPNKEVLQVIEEHVIK